MPLPLYTSEKPSTSETGRSDSPPDTKTTSESPNNSSSAVSQAAMDELARTTARRNSISLRHEAEGPGHVSVGGQGGHGQGNQGGRRELTTEEADQAYEEAMEDEYAKREGGA